MTLPTPAPAEGEFVLVPREQLKLLRNTWASFSYRYLVTSEVELLDAMLASRPTPPVAGEVAEVIEALNSVLDGAMMAADGCTTLAPGRYQAIEATAERAADLLSRLSASQGSSGAESGWRGIENAPIFQRADDDCTICAIAMATGLSYERVMKAAVDMDAGGYRYGGTLGTMSPKGLLMDLGFSVARLGVEAIEPGTLKRLLWGRRAILSVPSLNGFAGHHDVYWDGRDICDPTNKVSYSRDTLAAHRPLWAVLICERTPPPPALDSPVSRNGEEG